MAKNILKEAIADAKAVREVALANAKAALEEAFTPRLQSMLSAKLSETLNEEEDELEENKEEIEEMYEDKEETNENYMEGEEDNLDEEIDLEEILNELELDEGEDSKEETVDEAEEGSEDTIDEAEGDEDLEEAVGYPNHRADQVHKVKHDANDINLGLNEGDGFDLNALLEEINNLDETEEEVEEAFAPEMGRYSTDKAASGKGPEKVPLKGESWEEYISRVPDSAWIDWFKQDPARIKANFSEGESVYEEIDELKAALEVKTTELNEVNLLNSKLLYVNRIFKANQLDEGQKLRVVETLDNAETIKEAKLIYNTIKDTFTVANNKKASFKSKTKSLKEGIGMASRAAGTSTAPKKEVIAESNNLVSRMQKLANITIKQ